MKNKKKRILICIDHDITIRHFIKSGAFKDLKNKYELVYAFNQEKKGRRKTETKWIVTNIHELGLNNVNTTKITRQRMGSWHMIYAITILHNQRGTKNYAGRRKRFVELNGKLRTLLNEILSLPLIYTFARKYYLRKQGIDEPFFKFVKEISPDLIIYPSILVGYYVNELLIIKDRLNIPLIILMNSWDNPSQKAVVTGNPTKLVVWGEQTKEHAIEYLKMPEKDILIFGAAQFDIYKKNIAGNKENILNEFNLPNDVPILLYGGVSRSINETAHLKIIDDAINYKKINKCHILYRPHPWRVQLSDGEANFFECNYSNITFDQTMAEYYKRICKNPQNEFEMAEYINTKKILSIISATISSFSTIQLETLMHGKPTLSILTEADMESKFGKSVIISERLAHYYDLWNRPGVIVCRSETDIIDSMNRLIKLSGDKVYSDEIRKGSSYIIDNSEPSYSKKLDNLVEQLL